MNVDLISSLPTDEYPNKPYELQIIDNIFKQENKNSMKNVLFILKDILIAGALFFILTTPIVDRQLSKIYSSNFFYNSLLKTSIFMFLLFLILNIYLVRKPN